MNIVPAIDIRGGNCVRLLQGNFGCESFYDDDPARLAREYAEIGFRQLHVVDLDGARVGRQENRELVMRIAADSAIAVQLGGGVRDGDTIEDWLEAGVSRCVVGSVAVEQRDRVQDWLAYFGPDRILPALDVRLDDTGTPRLATRGWTQTTDLCLWRCVDDYAASGLTDVLCTDINCDGTLQGPNFSLYEEFVTRYPGIRLQASGGVRHIQDLRALRELGADSAITGRALLDGRISRAEVTSFLHDA